MYTGWLGQSKISAAYFGIIVLVGIAWVFLGLYQSHYIIGLRMLGDLQSQNFLGFPKEGRGDEWSTYIPMLKQAFLEGFPAQSSLEPYREKLDWFIAIPKWDASLFFLPHQLLFWLYPERALSFEGFYYNALLLVSAYWLLRNLDVRSLVAVTASIFIAFSHFYQVWWTSNFPALGASLLPYAVLTSNVRRDVKYPLLFWSLGHMLFGQIYPPFAISIAVGLLPIIVVLKPGLVNIRDVLLSAVAAGLALTSFVLVRWDFVHAVAGTSYPGLRHEVGGGGTFLLLLSTVFPTIPVGSAPTKVDTVHEMSVVSSLLPIIFLSLIPNINWDRRTVYLTIVTALFLTFMGLYITVGFPGWLADVTGFYMVPGRRMLIGFSILVLVYTTIVVSKNWAELNWWNVLPFIGVYTLLSFGVGVRADGAEAFAIYPWLLWVPIATAAAASCAWWFVRNRVNYGTVAVGSVLAVMAVMHIVSYGSFNPLMHARDILSPVDSQFTRDIKSLVSFNGGKPVAVLGNYGDLLRGENLPVLNAIHLANVEPSIYTAALKTPEGDLDRLFNRFRGIMFDNIDQAEDRGGTVALPLSEHAIGFNHTAIGSDDRSGNIIGREPLVASHPVEGGTDVYWTSFISNPLPINSELKLSFSCTFSNSWMTRFPVLLPGQPMRDVALQGVAGKVLVNSKDAKSGEACIRSMGISLEGLDK